MAYVLSDHARKQILTRKIRAEWIEATLADPSGIEPDDDDSTLTHAWRPIPERGFRILRVIYHRRYFPLSRPKFQEIKIEAG